MQNHRRRSPRIASYDYSTENYYFITICCHEKSCIFWESDRLNQLGSIAEQMLLKIGDHFSDIFVDKYVIMPNHVHLILVIQGKDNGYSADMVIGLYKSGVTREIRKLVPGKMVWQRSFHDRVIRCQEEYEKIWSYIDTNPLRWEADCFYIKE